MNGTNYEVPHCGAFSTPILIPLGPKYSPQDPVLKYRHSSLNVRDHVSEPYSTTGNIIVLHILIFKFLERSLENIHDKIQFEEDGVIL